MEIYKSNKSEMQHGTNMSESKSTNPAVQKSGQTGGRESEGSSEKFGEEFFFRDGLNWLSTHRGFQIYPILAGQKFCWLRK